MASDGGVNVDGLDAPVRRFARQCRALIGCGVEIGPGY